MTVAPWSLNSALSAGVVLVDLKDLQAFRAAANVKGGISARHSDAALVSLMNFAISTTIGLASAIDKYDRRHYEDQERFKTKLAELKSCIETLSEPLRGSVTLPEEYLRNMDANVLLNYAQRRPAKRPPEWRTDEFYMSLLLMFQLVTGAKPTGAEGPTVRFFRKVIEHLQQCLKDVTDPDTELMHSLSRLWKLPHGETPFLKNWFERKEAKGIDVHEALQRQIDRLQYLSFWQGSAIQ